MTRHGPVVSTNTLQVVMFYTTPDTNMQNTYHVHKNTTWSLSDVQAIAEWFYDWEDANAKPLRSQDVTLNRVTATDLTSLTAPRQDNNDILPLAGTIPASALPANVTFAIKGNIGSRGKGRNGRTYWVGLAENQVVGQQITSAAAAGIVTALDALRDGVGGAVPGASLGVIHLFIDKTYMNPAPFSAITSWKYTDLYLDSQKDRLPGHRKHKRPTP